MEELKTYLARYKNLKAPHASTIKLLIQTVNDECGITLIEKNVSIRQGGVVLSCHPTVRSELLQNSTHIISLLHKKYNVRISFIR
ncbi:TPA: hypothetical protein DEP58_04700 [Patescibacteria group bacterium]|nr:MAG: hypothetical protein UU98_C0002G0002 [Parcubacteria group bacterium GW2011_GWD2_42_14]HCC05566.1 hypothetical protein [Patescibacteria group bacterium]